jgi:hypothetical protein
MTYYATPATGLYFLIFDGLSPTNFAANVDANWQKLYDRWNVPYMPDWKGDPVDDGKVMVYDPAYPGFGTWIPAPPEDLSIYEYNALNLSDQGSANFIESVDGLTFTTVDVNDSWNGCRCNFGVSSGKWYWEMKVGSLDNYLGVGVCTPTASLESYVGNTADGWMWSDNYGATRNNGTNYCTGCSCAANDIIMCALDMDNRKFFVGKNGVWCGAGNPAAGTGYCGPLLPEATEMFPAVILYNNYPRTGTLNFGYSGFTYNAPAGFYQMRRLKLTTTTV